MQARQEIARWIISCASDVVASGRCLQAIARERAILLCRIWTALMLKRAIGFVESTHERDCRDFNLNKAEVLAALRCLHDQILDGPPLAGVSPRQLMTIRRSRQPRGEQGLQQQKERTETREDDDTTTMW